jgi:peptidyl-prolyl cis-trans isomerase A (cyclophilin A)
VLFETTRGDFVMEVNRAWAPLGADRFHNLVRFGFYDGAGFFRVVPGFVVQFGLPAQPVLTSTWRGAPLDDDPIRESNVRGTVSYAMTGPNSRTTQVFINLGENSRLDAQGFAPFGRIVSGMEVVESLYSGYGEGAPRGAGPDQLRVMEEGSAYLQREFPQLDFIRRARIVN